LQGNYSMKVCVFLCFTCLLLAATSGIAAAQHGADTALTLADAEERALTQSYELRRQQALIEQRRAALESATTFPNPVAIFNGERLRNQDVVIHEWSLTAEYPLFSVLRRGGRIDAAGFSLQASLSHTLHGMQTLRFELRRRFLELWKARMLLDALTRIENMMNDLEQAVQRRADYGDIAEYERQRLTVEIAKLRWRITESTMNMQNAESALALLLALPADAVSDRTLLLPTLQEQLPDSADLLRLALDKREDLRALRHERAALNSHTTWLRSRWLEDFRIGGGYKEQSDAFAGPVLTIALPLPLLDRDRGAVQYTAAESDQVSAGILALEHRIGLDVQRAYRMFRQLQHRSEAVRALDSGDLFTLVTTAATAWHEGEFSLVEYLDAVRAWIEATELQTSVRGALLHAAFDLEYTIGEALFTFEY
jgi:outer membrane protein, heavy metal efflux system